MKEISALCAFLFVVVMAWYLPLLIRRRVQPAPATWIVGMFAMNISAFAAWYIPGSVIANNITLYSATVEISIVTIVMMFMIESDGTQHITFDRLQKTCLWITAAILVYWMLHHDQPQVTFWTTQVLLLIAYIATIGKAIRKRTAFDSIGNWGLICLASIVGSTPAIMSWNLYGLANSIRAILSSGFTVGILIYFDRRNDWRRWKDELQTLGNFYLGKRDFE